MLADDHVKGRDAKTLQAAASAGDQQASVTALEAGQQGGCPAHSVDRAGLACAACEPMQ